MKLPILQEATLCYCAIGSWCFGGLECLFIRLSIATNGTLGLPDSEDESSTILGKILNWWQSVMYQKIWIFSSIWCSVPSQLLIVMNVLEISYNFFLKNYKVCIWRFVSGMLTFVLGEWSPTFWSKISASTWTIILTWKSHHFSMNSVHSFKTSHSNHPWM
jgi:hypothetical protein